MSDLNKGYYAIIPANIRYDNDIPANAKLFYAEITALCNEKGYCWANNDYFAELYDVSDRTVGRWISILCKKNYIVTEYKYKAGTKEILKRYIKLVGSPSTETTENEEDSVLGGDKNVTTYRQKCPIGGDKNVRDNNIIYNNIYKDILSGNEGEPVDNSVDNSANTSMECSKSNNSDTIKKIIEHLNKKCGVNYKATSAKTQTSINARLNEGFVLQDFFKVIDIKCAEWLNNPEMNKYLRPETLFGSKFEGYLNQKQLPVKQSQVKKPANKFHNFIQSDDFSGEDLEDIARKRFEKNIKRLSIGPEKKYPVNDKG